MGKAVQSIYNTLIGTEQGAGDANRVVNVTAATLALAQASHSGKVVTLNRAAGIAVTLPAAVGSGLQVMFFLGTTVTSNTTTIATAGSDVYNGSVIQCKNSDGSGAHYSASTAKTITLNGTTTGGIKGDTIFLTDVATGVWSLWAVLNGSGTLATPLS
jgi:hypothetical protein